MVLGCAPPITLAPGAFGKDSVGNATVRLIEAPASAQCASGWQIVLVLPDGPPFSPASTSAPSARTLVSVPQMSVPAPLPVSSGRISIASPVAVAAVAVVLLVGVLLGRASRARKPRSIQVTGDGRRVARYDSWS